jgi:hypothetical protein
MNVAKQPEVKSLITHKKEQLMSNIQEYKNRLHKHDKKNAEGEVKQKKKNP